MGKLIVVVGGQFGSEAKGHVAAYLGQRQTGLLAVRVGGSNAGHTVYTGAGDKKTKFAFRHLPVAAVSNEQAELALAAGSEIDWEVLEAEIREVNSWNTARSSVTGRLMVDAQATVVDPEDMAREQGITTGTTGKGVGGARAARSLRQASLVGTCGEAPMGIRDLGIATGDVGLYARAWLASGGTVLIEGTQGWGLGSHAGFYPHCTSGDCRAIDFMAQAGISPWAPEVTELEIWVVYRCHPIRIAGNSGPLEKETSWEAIGVPAEYTTVTKKMRRVGEWDRALADASLHANGGPSENVHIAVMFADYLLPDLAGATYLFSGDHRRQLIELNRQLFGFSATVELWGTGPDTIIDWRRNK